MANTLTQNIFRCLASGAIWGVVPVAASKYIFNGALDVGYSLWGDPNKGEQPKGYSKPTKQQLLDHVDKSNMTPEQKQSKKDVISKKLNPDGSPHIPFYQDTWSQIKQNPWLTAGIGAGVIGIPLITWLMTRNKDQDQYQQEQEDQNSYKYKYGRR